MNSSSTFLAESLVQAPLLLKTGQHLGPDADEITLHRRGFQFQTGHLPVVLHGGQISLVIHPEVGPDKLCFQFRKYGFVQQGDLVKEIPVQGVLVHPQLGGFQPYGGDAPALTIAPVVHLHRGFEYMPAADRDVAGQTGNPAPAFFGLRPAGKTPFADRVFPINEPWNESGLSPWTDSS